MHIRLKFILEELGYEYEGDIDERQNPSFECAELFSPKGADLSGKKLLICPLSEALMLPKQADGPFFLCTRDRMVDSNETPETMQGIIVIRKNVDLRQLFNEVQRVFVRINDWVMDMQSSVMYNKGIQDIIDISEPIIGNHIVVLDPTFKLLAYTKNIYTDDEVQNNLVKHGYHTEETIKRFQFARRIEQYERAEDIIVSDDYYISKYVTVKKIFHFRDTYSVLVVMLCCPRNISDGLLDLFRIMLNYVKIYVDREYSNEWSYSPCESLMFDLLEGKQIKEDEVKNRAFCVGIPFSGDFDLYKLVLKDTINAPVNSTILKLTSLLPESKVFLYHRDILVFNLYNNIKILKKSTVYLERIWNAMHDQIDCIGISNPFNTLWGTRIAYRQTCTAVEIGKRLKEKRSSYSADKTEILNYRIEDYVIYYMLEHCLTNVPELFENSFAFNIIRQLLDFDRKHGTECTKLLHTYLQCERKATNTCSQLHMHRNTILYHISRIEETYGINLDDPETRLKLLLAFKALEFDRTEKNYSLGETRL